MVITRKIQRIRMNGEYFTGCPRCGTFMEENGNFYDCPNCKQRIRIPPWNRLKDNWRFRLCLGKDGIVNIAAVNLETGAIGRMRIPEQIIDNPSYHIGDTMEEVIEKFGSFTPVASKTKV